MLYAYTVHKKNISHGAINECCRSAVLRPLTFSSKADDIFARYTKLVSMWRDRVRTLRNSGWWATRASKAKRMKAGKDAKEAAREAANLNYTFICNCPPFGAVFAPRAARCTNSRICPMCYARRVVIPAYSALEWAWYCGNSRPVLDAALVATRFDRNYKADIGDLVKAIGVEHKRQLKLLPHFGAVSYASLSPGRGPDGKPSKEHVRFCQSILFCTTDTADLERLGAGNGFIVKRVLSSEITKKKISNLTAWAMRYPVGMMFGDAKLAVSIDKAMHGKRIRALRSVGNLRNAQTRTLARAVIG